MRDFEFKAGSLCLDLVDTVSERGGGDVDLLATEADVARWVLNAMISAEELGVNSQNIEEMKSSTKPSVRRLLGLEGDFGEQLGLDKDWAYRVISLVGNYGEVYDANVGPNTPLKLERGVNAQWKDGGLIYAMPIR